MTSGRTWLCAAYAVIAAGALVATWSQNLAYLAHGPAADLGRLFLLDARVNPAARSLTADIFLVVLAAAAFMVVEARRLGMRFVWAYVIGGCLVAISVTFPLFLLARELKLARGPAAPTAGGRLTLVDGLGLAAVTALVLWLVGFTLAGSAA